MTMTKSVAKIRFETRPVKAGPGWLVIVTFPDRPEMQVRGFATEADAQNWITNDSSVRPNPIRWVGAPAEITR
jgi:hypothetical protein